MATYKILAIDVDDKDLTDDEGLVRFECENSKDFIEQLEESLIKKYGEFEAVDVGVTIDNTLLFYHFFYDTTGWYLMKTVGSGCVPAPIKKSNKDGFSS